MRIRRKVNSSGKMLELRANQTRTAADAPRRSRNDWRSETFLAQDQDGASDAATKTSENTPIRRREKSAPPKLNPR